jgi:hypothetical protein
VYALKSVFNVLVTVLLLPPRCVAVFLCCNASAAAFHLRAIDLFIVSDESGAAVAEVIEVVEQVSQVVAGEEGMPANDPAGSFQELKYAKVATVDAAAEYVPYEPVGYQVYRGTDPAQAVEGMSSDQFFDSAYTPILQSVISRVVMTKAQFWTAFWPDV